MSDRWTDTLSEYLDGDMPATEARELERHIESCEECRLTLEQLRGVMAGARALVDPPAPDDLWAGIASRIGTAGSTSASRGKVLELPFHMRSVALPWAMAAGFALLLMGAAGMWFVMRGPAPSPGSIAQRDADTPANGGVQYASFDAAQVETEIAQLQSALEHGRSRLDPKTVEVLEKNLTIIRQATADARLALAKDPANRELQTYFAGTVGRKLDLVRRAATLAGV